MAHYVYLASILASGAGVMLLGRRIGLRPLGPRLALAVAVTVPAFLALDALGAWRGWFRSDARLSIAILPPGISFEEPFLLAFLVVLSIVLQRGAAFLLREARERR